MLNLRVISAVIGIPILLTILYVGGFYLAFFLFALIFIANLEFKNILQKDGQNISLIPIVLGEGIFLLTILYNLEHGFSLGIGLTLFWSLLIFINRFPRYKIKDVGATLLTLIYIGWSLSNILAIRNLENGFLLIVFLFLIIWSSDTGAYFTGRFLGKHKLAVQLSPKKTKEGAVGGLALSLIVGLIFNMYFQLIPLGKAIIFSLIVSIAGQLGDLIESGFKRLAGVKDAGNIIPGHGGILDRFDSTITAAPVFFFLLFFF